MSALFLHLTWGIAVCALLFGAVLVMLFNRRLYMLFLITVSLVAYSALGWVTLRVLLHR